MAPKAKGKGGKAPPKVDLKAAASGPPPKPKKPPPIPPGITNEDIMRFKEMFKLFDEDGIDKVPLGAIPIMLRKLGYNPKNYEVAQLFKLFLEDDLVDMVEFMEFVYMVDQKIKWGDDFEADVTKAMAALGHDDEEVGIANIELIREELFQWGEPLNDAEWADFPKQALKDKTLIFETSAFNYVKFIENMNAKDALMRAVKEPINFFKLDQKTLAEMAQKKAQEEKEEQLRKEAEKLAREEARRQRMIASGLAQE